VEFFIQIKLFQVKITKKNLEIQRMVSIFLGSVELKVVEPIKKARGNEKFKQIWDLADLEFQKSIRNVRK
jgi:hypothetical protein